MPPKVNVTLTIEGRLVDDLDDLAEELNTDRSPLICEASKRIINDAIDDEYLDADGVEKYDTEPIEPRGIQI